MKSIDVEKNMCFINTILPNRYKGLFILDKTDKYIECFRISYETGNIEIKTFKIGRDWDRSMLNYELCSEYILIDFIMGEK